MRYPFLFSVLFVFACLGFLKIHADELGTSGQAEHKNIHDEVKRMIDLTISDIDPASVADGTYIGEVPFMRYIYRVQVTVKSGKIEDIEVLDNGTGNKYAERALQVIPRMLKKQSPKVDAVTGATVTSKALMRCVEKALNQSK